MPWLPAGPGTYALLIRMPAERTITVGQLGELDLNPGWYIYVGSALGPGGLAARLARHLKAVKTRRWHIDYLRAAAAPEAVWYTGSVVRQECHWAAIFARMKSSVVPLDGFGASDCRCRSHLFCFTRSPRIRTFRRNLMNSPNKVAQPRHGTVIHMVPLR